MSKKIAQQSGIGTFTRKDFFNLRRMKTWFRNRVGEERSTGLALMSLDRDKIGFHDADVILDSFRSNKNR